MQDEPQIVDVDRFQKPETIDFRQLLWFQVERINRIGDEHYERWSAAIRDLYTMLQPFLSQDKELNEKAEGIFDKIYQYEKENAESSVTWVFPKNYREIYQYCMQFMAKKGWLFEPELTGGA